MEVARALPRGLVEEAGQHERAIGAYHASVTAQKARDAVAVADLSPGAWWAVETERAAERPRLYTSAVEPRRDQEFVQRAEENTGGPVAAVSVAKGASLQRGRDRSPIGPARGPRAQAISDA